MFTNRSAPTGAAILPPEIYSPLGVIIPPAFFGLSRTTSTTTSGSSAGAKPRKERMYSLVPSPSRSFRVWEVPVLPPMR